MLDGKKYTFVTVNSFFSRRDPTDERGFLLSTNAPEVRTSQVMAKVSVYHDDDGKYAGFNVSDTYGVWGVSTSATENVYDPTFEKPYFVFEYNQVRFYHRAPAGNSLVWVIAIED
jgi:hypothetical protein